MKGTLEDAGREQAKPENILAAGDAAYEHRRPSS